MIISNNLGDFHDLYTSLYVMFVMYLMGEIKRYIYFIIIYIFLLILSFRMQKRCSGPVRTTPKKFALVFEKNLKIL